MTRLPPHRNYQLEQLDSIGFGKITEMQMKAFLEMVKNRKLLVSPPPEPTGRNGIVIAGGGKYLDWSWVACRWLRHKQIQHPIQVWHLGPHEMPPPVRRHFASLDVELVDAFEVRQKHWHRSLKGWNCKHYAAAYAPFDNVASYDADAFALVDPAHVWEDPDYLPKGALFFSDIKPCRANDWAYVLAAVRIPNHEQESGVFFWNRQQAWYGIKMTLWFGEHCSVWDKMIWGDKCRPYLAFGTTNTPFIQSTERSWKGWGIEQSWKNQVIANHAMAWKRKEANAPDPLLPAFFEEWRGLTG